MMYCACMHTVWLRFGNPRGVQPVLPALPMCPVCITGDKSAMVPGGMRIGTPALTTRGFKEAEFVQVANFIDRAVKIAKDCQQKTPAPGERQLTCCRVLLWRLSGSRC